MPVPILDPGFPLSYVVVFWCSVSSVQITVVVCFVDIGGIVVHHCLELIVWFVDIGGIVDHHCLEMIVWFVDIGGIVDHHCLEVIAVFVDVGGIGDITVQR